jgi:hypothetical protein
VVVKLVVLLVEVEVVEVEAVVDFVVVGGELFSTHMFWLSQENPTGQYWIPLGQQLPSIGIHTVPQLAKPPEAQLVVV